MSKNGFKVGQKVWYCPKWGYSTAGSGKEMTVVKVGRKIVTIDDGGSWSERQFDSERPNGSQEGYLARDKRGNGVGMVYFDQQNYIYCSRRKAMWEKLVRALAHCPYPPQDLTLLGLKSILTTLGMDNEPAGDKV
jgi:hypothetical protein